MLVPKSLDPEERARKMPLPDPRPSEKIAKLLPQNQLAKDKKDTSPAQTSAVAQAQTGTPVVAPVPLPEARPATAPSREPLRRGRLRQRSTQ